MTIPENTANKFESESDSHPRTLSWIGTVSLALGGSNQSLFLIILLIAGQRPASGFGSAAIVMLGVGLLLSWAAAPGWTELVLMWPNRVGGIAATCAEAFRPYSPILSNLTGVCYWWGWIPTCGITALFSASAMIQLAAPSEHGLVFPLACLIVGLFWLINLNGIKFTSQIVTPVAVVGAVLGFLSASIPIVTKSVDWHRALDIHLTTPFPGSFGWITSAMAGVYLVGFAAPAFEAATCHVGETIDPKRNVPKAVLISASVSGVYFVILPLLWLGRLPFSVWKPDAELINVLGPTFAPLLGSGIKAAAIFVICNMLCGTAQPLAGASRTLAQLSEDGLLPKVLSLRNKYDVPWVATTLTAVVSLIFLAAHDPVRFIAAANLAYLIGIGLPSVAVWLLRKNAPQMTRMYRAPTWTINLGMAAAAVWGLSVLLGFQQYGLQTVLFGLMLAYSGAVLYLIRRVEENRVSRKTRLRWNSLHVKLTGAMLLVLALDGLGYLLAVEHVGHEKVALIAILEDIFVAVALLTLSVGMILPGVIAHATEELAASANELATGTLSEFSSAMRALGRGDIDGAKVQVTARPLAVRSGDEVGEIAKSFNVIQHEISVAADGLEEARLGLRAAHDALISSNISLEDRINDRTSALQFANDELQTSEQRFKSLVQNASDVITVIDADGSIRYTSPSIERLLGYDPASLLAKKVRDFIHSDDCARVDEIDDALYAKPKLSAITELRLRHRNGTYRYFEVICRNHLADPAVVGIVINCRDVTERHLLEEERQELLMSAEGRAERESLINALGTVLRGAASSNEIEEIAVNELGKLLDADRCYFAFYDLTNDTVEIRYDWCSSGKSSLIGSYVLSDFKASVDEILADGKTLVLHDVRQSGFNSATITKLEMMGLRSGIRVPVSELGKLSAVLTVAMASGPRLWTNDEIILVETIASQVKSAVENARVHEREHKIAETLQSALLPPLPTGIPGLDVNKYYKAALDESKIGGDFYDVFNLGEGKYAFVVGDVSGKGLAAAAQVATVRHMLRCVLYLGLNAEEAVRQLNSLLIDHELLLGFLTLCVAIYDSATSTVSHVSCGHEPTFVRRVGSDVVELLNPSGMPLGISATEQYEQSIVALAPGDAIMLYTDGLTEAGVDRSYLLGTEGLSKILAGCPDGLTASEMNNNILAKVEDFAGVRLRDDVCVVTLIATTFASQLADAKELQIVTLSHKLDVVPFGELPSVNAEYPVSLELTSLSAQIRYERLLEFSPDMIATVVGGRFVSVNSSGLILLGATSVLDVAGKRIAEFVAPQYRGLFLARLRRLTQGHSIEQTEQRWITLDGRSIYVELTASPLDISVESSQFIIRDVTDRKKNEEEHARLLCDVQLSASRQHSFLRDVLASVSEGHLNLCEDQDDLPDELPRFGAKVSLTHSDIRQVRYITADAAKSINLSDERANDLLIAVGEAAMNAVAHGGGGQGWVCANESLVQVWIRDDGSGISHEHLPQALLERGFTTGNSLGYGFWMILQAIDHVWLLTGSEGTTVVLEQNVVQRDETLPSGHLNQSLRAPG